MDIVTCLLYLLCLLCWSNGLDVAQFIRTIFHYIGFVRYTCINQITRELWPNGMALLAEYQRIRGLREQQFRTFCPFRVKCECNWLQHFALSSHRVCKAHPVYPINKYIESISVPHIRNMCERETFKCIQRLFFSSQCSLYNSNLD